MIKHFSSEQLRHLRNDIPMEALIETLGVSTKHCSDDLFRFQCPCCFGYHTAVHPQTNLARCFTCRENLNSIEIVMLVKQIPFIAGVKFLEQYESTLAKTTRSPAPQKPRQNSTPISIGELLRQIANSVKEPL